MPFYVAVVNGSKPRGKIVGYRHNDFLGEPVHVEVYECDDVVIDDMLVRLFHPFYGIEDAPIGPLSVCFDIYYNVPDIHGLRVYKEPRQCVIDLGAWYPREIAVLIPLSIECTSPVSRVCRIEGQLANEVTRIEAFTWNEYWYRDDIVRYEAKSKHLQISTRWVSGCGVHTRVYVRSDGALVLSHDEYGYEGVHVIYFKKPVWEILGFSSIDELARHVDAWCESQRGTA
ncbi:MAG: hypothetical protein DRO39_07255 [Thermoprotei archaeon]|nr:MAG: hypothetical protein DRO39_07255 [Thermoprotei archaeon]